MVKPDESVARGKAWAEPGGEQTWQERWASPVGVRLLKADRARLERMATERNMTPGQFAREILTEVLTRES